MNKVTITRDGKPVNTVIVIREIRLNPLDAGVVSFGFRCEACGHRSQTYESREERDGQVDAHVLAAHQDAPEGEETTGT